MKNTTLNFLKADLRMPQLMFWDWIFPMVLVIGVSIFIKSSDFSKFLLPGLVGVFILQSIIFSIPYRIAQFNEQGILDLVRTKGKIVKLYMSFYLSRVIILVVQVALIILLGKLIFNVRLDFNIPMLIISFIISVAVFMLLATLCGTLIKSENAALGIAQAIYFTLIAASGVFYPISQSPEIIKIISKISPLTYISQMWNESLFSVNSNMVENIAISCGIGIVLLIINIRVNSKKIIGEV